MYLSRVRMDISHRGVRNALRDCNELHRDLMSAFPKTQAEGSARACEHLLFRVIERRNEISLLMTSDSMPDVDRLRERGYILTPDCIREISALKEVFRPGMFLRFELLAFPSKKSNFGTRNSRRVFLREEKERVDWLVRQGEKYGFRICEQQEDAVQTRIGGRKQEMHIHYEAVRFTGILQVTDTERFWEGYRHGVGPGKAYGLGMLTVSKVG